MRMKQVWSRWFTRDEDKKKALRARLDFAMTQNGVAQHKQEKNAALHRSDRAS